jgi:hypothetical protein
MASASEAVSEFFDEYARATDSSDLAFFESAYGDTFMFAGPTGAQAVSRADFLKVLPKRQGFFKTVGLVSSTIHSLEETRLDDHYLMVEACWSMRFKKDREHSVVDRNSATYILRRHEGFLQIVFQLDHQDLAARAQDRGLLPPTS